MATNIYHKVICEVYVSGKISHIANRISEFVKMSEFLLRLDVDTFYIYSSKEEYKILKIILNLYKNDYPELVIVNKDGKNQLCRKANYVIIFNWGEDIIAYDNKYNKIKLSKDYEDKYIFNNEPLEVDLMP